MDLQLDNTLKIPNIISTPKIDTQSKDLQLIQDPNYIEGASSLPVGWTTPLIQHQAEFEKLPTGTYINPSNIDLIKENVAKNQTMWELTKNIADRTVVGEIIGGGLGTLGALDPRKLIGRWNGDKDAFEKNLFEQVGSDIQESTNERSPLFMTRDAQEGASWAAFHDATYWANMTPSVASTLSIMLPSMGIAALAKYTGIALKALTAAGELTKAGEVASEFIGLAGTGFKEFGAVGKALIKGDSVAAKTILNASGEIEALQVARPISETARVAKASIGLKNAAGVEQGFVESLWKAANETSRTNRMTGGFITKIPDIFIPAIASRTMDSSREAVGRYQQYYDEYKNIFKDDADGGEAKARQLAGEAAHKGFVESHANIIFDLAEWTILGGLGKQGSALESISTTTLNKAAREKLGEQAASAMGMDIVHTGVKGALKHFAKSELPEYFKSALTEGFDETFMDFFMNEGKRKNDIEAGLQKDDDTTTLERIIAHHSIAKNWDSFIGGAMGGVAMAGVMDTYKGVKNKYFNEKGNAFNKEMAEAIAGRMVETQALYGQYNRARDNGNHAEAAILKAKIIAKVIGESYATGTTGLDIKTFENMSKLNDAQKSQLDVFKDENGNVIKDSNLYNDEVLKGLKDAQNIYDIEFGKTHHTDRDINNAIQHHNAYSKTMIASLEGDLKTLNDIKAKSTNPQIETNRVSALQDLTDKHGDSVNGLYEIIKSYKTALNNLTNDNSRLDGMRAIQLTSLDAFSTKKQQLETAIEESDNPTNTNRLKQQLHNLLQKQDIEHIVLNTIENKIKSNETKLASNEETYKQQLEDFHKANTIENKDEHHADVEKVFDDYAKANENLSTNESAIKNLENQIKSIKDNTETLNTKEAIQKFADRYNSEVKEIEDKITSDFEDTISELNTEEDIDNAFRKVPKNITVTTIKKLGELRNKRLNEIKDLEERTRNVNVTPTTEPVTTPTDEGKDATESLLTSSPTRSHRTVPIGLDILNQAITQSGLTNIVPTIDNLATIKQYRGKTNIKSIQETFGISYAKAKTLANIIDTLQQQSSTNPTQNTAVVTNSTDVSSIETVPSLEPVIDDESNIQFNDTEISNIIDDANLQLSKVGEDVEFELARRLLLHLFNYNGVRYVVNNNTDEINEVLASLVDKINKSLLIDNPNGIEEIQTYDELINHIFNEDMNILLPNVKPLIKLALRQHSTILGLQNSMERSIEDFENISTEEQKFISAKIIKGIYRITDTKSINYIDALTSKLELFRELINLKKSITGLNSIYMSVEDAIRLLKESTVISEISITDELLLEVAKSLPTIFQSLSNDISQTRNSLIAEKLNYLESQGINPKDIDYKNLTYSVEENGKLIQNINLIEEDNYNDNALKFYNDLYHHIYFEKNTKIEGGKKIEITKDYNDKYILNIIKNYNPSTTITSNIDINFNNSLDEESTEQDKIDMANIALNLRVGDNVTLSNPNDGTNNIHIMHNGNIIGIIPDITTDYNNIKVSDNGKTYTGFSKIIPTIEQLFTSEETSVASEMGLPQTRYGSIQLLTQLQSNLLKSEANNLPDKVKNDAARQYHNTLNKILNATTGSEYLIKQIVEKFILANNSDIDESYNITTKDIESVLKILFHNVNASFLKDDTVVEFNYFKARIKAFDRNMETRYTAYNRYKSFLGTSTVPVAAQISKIGRANILTKNIKNKLPLEQSVAKIIDEHGNGEVPILFGTAKGVNSASGKFHVGVGSGLFTLVRNTNGQLSSVPLHSNTLGNHSTQATKYVTNKILEAVKEFQTILNSNDTENVKLDKQNIIRLKLKDAIGDLVIFKSRMNDEAHPYFHSISVEGNEIIKFITIDKGNTIEHSIRITPNEVFYSKIDTSDTHNLTRVKGGQPSRRSEVMNFRPSEVSNPHDIHLDYDSNNIDSLAYDLNSNDGKGISNMLRHNGTTDGVFTLNNKDFTTNKYKDVVTGKTYDTVHEYLIDTNAVYAEIDNISTEDEHRNKQIVSNVDVLGKGFNFDISLGNLDTIKAGQLETKIIDAISHDNLLYEVSHILDDITNELKTTYGDKLVITHYGATEQQNIDRSKTLITTEHVPGTTSPYEIRYTYFNRYMTTILNNKFRMNPIVSLLHENIHAALFAASDFAKLATVINVDDSDEVIASKKAKLEQLKNTYNFVNSTSDEITTAIKTQLDIIKNDEIQRLAFVAQFEGILDNPNDIFNIITQRLEDIARDTNKSAKNLSDGKTDSSAMAQEIFTYFTDPVMMLALSTIENAKEGNYTAKHEGGFFATILSKLMDIYTRVMKLLGINLNQNYTKQIGDLLNDTYIELMNITHGVEESKFETKTPIEVKEEITKPTSTLEELLEEDTDEYSLEISDLNFGSSEIISIFANNVFNDNVTTNTDDTEQRIC